MLHVTIGQVLAHPDRVDPGHGLVRHRVHDSFPILELEDVVAGSRREEQGEGDGHKGKVGFHG